MRHFHDNYGLTLAGALAGLLGLALVSCQVAPEPRDAAPESAYQALTFGLLEEPEEGVATRSLLTASDIETKKTCITLAAYTGGRLYGKQHYTSNLGAMTFSLRAGATYNIYALVNMGDMTASFGDDESSVSTVSYLIPSYTSGSQSVATAGIPMAGFLEIAVTSSTSGTKAIPVKRLLAKVTATLSCDWTGAVIRSAKVWNMNGRLTPFGGALSHGSSRAVDASADILAFQEIHGTSNGTGSTLSATFYVPENMQGTVQGIANSSDKRPDGGNATVNAKRNILSYLEVLVNCSGSYGGSITYRSYLGSNATTDFNIARNTHYAWTIAYHEDGLQDDNWKKDNDLSDNRYLNLTNPIWVEPGDVVSWSGVISSNIAVSSITKTFSDGNVPYAGVIGSSGSSSFTVSSAAVTGTYADLTAVPSVNPTASLTRHSQVRVADKLLAWRNYDQSAYIDEGKKIYPVTPVSGSTPVTVDAPVDYYMRWAGTNEHILGAGGTTSSAEWNYTAAPVSSPSNGITSAYVAGSGSTFDKVVYSVKNTVPPGDYPVTVVRTKAGKTGVHDDAFIRVADTRFLRWTDKSGTISDSYTNYTYTEDEVHTYCAWHSYYAMADRSWYQPNYYEFGDASGLRSICGTSIYGTAKTLATLDFLVNENGDGTTWVSVDNSTLFDWYNSSYPNSSVAWLKTTQDLDPGVYALKISFKDGSKSIVSYLHVEDVVTKELVVEPSPVDVYVGQTVRLYARLYTVVNGVRTSYVDKSSSATFTIPYSSNYLSHLGGGVFRGERAYNGALVYASVTEDGVTYNANSITTRGTVNILADSVLSYDDPVVTLTYDPNPIAYTGGTSTPTLSVSQVAHLSSGGTRTLTTGYTVQSYTGTSAGFTVNATSGVVSASSNEGATTVTYGTPAASLSYTGSPIACAGGVANPTFTYSQSKTTSRAQTSSRSVGVTVTVSMNGRTGTGTATVAQSRDDGASSSETLTSGGTVTYSGSASGFTVGATGIVTASSNEGATSTSYGTPSVTAVYNPNPIAYIGGTSTPTVSYSQVRTDTRAQTSSRSVTVTGTVTMNGESGSATASVSQAGDAGASTTSTLYSGGTVSYSGSRAGFTLDGSTGAVTAASNEGTVSYTYGNPSVTLSYSGSPIAYTGGSATPTVSYTQTRTATRAATTARSISVTVSVAMNGRTGSQSVSVSQDRDAGGSSSETLTDGGSVSFSGSSTGFTVNSASGLVTAAANYGSSSVSYANPAVTLDYNPNTFGPSGGIAVPALDYSQVKTTTRASSAQRSVGVRATVTANGRSGQSAQVSVVQGGDPGGSSSETLTTGGSVSWSMDAATGFSLNAGTGNITVSQNNSTSQRSTYGRATVTMNGRSGTASRQIVQQPGTVTYELVYAVPANTSSSNRARLEVGYTQTLRVQLRTYVNGSLTGTTYLSNSSVTWSSSNTARATVSSSGVVSAISAGDVNMTAYYTPSGYSQLSATAYLTVLGAGSGASWNDDWFDGGEVPLN